MVSRWYASLHALVGTFVRDGKVLHLMRDVCGLDL
jgi:hypothetical protein